MKSFEEYMDEVDKEFPEGSVIPWMRNMARLESIESLLSALHSGIIKQGPKDDSYRQIHSPDRTKHTSTSKSERRSDNTAQDDPNHEED